MIWASPRGPEFVLVGANSFPYKVGDKDGLFGCVFIPLKTSYFQNGLLDMAKECLKMYFMKPPPGNQFLCRAYLCQAQLLAPTATNPVSN